MTIEMIKQIENDYWEEKADPIDMAEVFDLAQKALEQETKTENNGFEGMTNRDVLKALFSIDENKGTRFTKVYLDHEAIESFELLTTQKWLDSPYKGVSK